MNFLNSPGANIMRTLGIKGPWSQQGGQGEAPPPVAYDPSGMTGPIYGAGLQPPPQAQVPDQSQGQMLPYKRPEGLLNKLTQLFMGGG